MKKYVVQYNEQDGFYYMDKVMEPFVGVHLYNIATENNIKELACSESKLLAILQSHGIDIELLDSDGSPLTW